MDKSISTDVFVSPLRRFNRFLSFLEWLDALGIWPSNTSWIKGATNLVLGSWTSLPLFNSSFHVTTFILVGVLVLLHSFERYRIYVLWFLRGRLRHTDAVGMDDCTKCAARYRNTSWAYPRTHQPSPCPAAARTRKVKAGITLEPNRRWPAKRAGQLVARLQASFKALYECFGEAQRASKG
jgi:hypothetical protein